MTFVSSKPEEQQAGSRWSIEEAEGLLTSLTEVLSARIVARPGGEVEEVHVLTTESVSPKQTVRNVESALLARFDLALDHRKISVAQTSRPVPHSSISAAPMAVVVERDTRREDARILFKGHRADSEDPHRVRVTVSLQWEGQTHVGLATGADLPRARMEATANATLRAIEGAASTSGADQQEFNEGEHPTPPPVSLALDGVKLVEAFDRHFAFVAVHAMSGREIISLAGTAGVEDNLDRSVVLATLQATDRWVRGRAH